MKKRIVSLLLAVVLIVSLLPETIVSATTTESTAMLTVEEPWASPGGTVEVNLVIAENPGVLGATLVVSWDESLTLIADASGEAFAHMTYTSPSRYNASGTNFVWFGNEVGEAMDGIVLTLTFEVSNTAENNEILPIWVTYTPGDVVDGNDNDVAFSITDGYVRVITYKPGDVTGDGRVNSRDLVRLSQYISDGSKTDPEGYNAEVIVDACDVNGDGRINARDLIRLSQYISDGSQTDPNGYNAVLNPAKLPECAHASLTAMAAKAATCTEDGYDAYWVCELCGKYFSDANGTEEIALVDVKIPAAHTMTAVDRVEPTYTTAGNIAYWYCSVCEKCFADANAETELRQEDTVIPPLEAKEYLVTYEFIGTISSDSTADGAASSAKEWLKNKLEADPTYVVHSNKGAYSADEGLMLTGATAPGYSFEGWYDAAGNRVYEIAKGTTGEVKLYAHWTELVNTITYNIYQTPIEPIGSEYKTYTVSRGLTNDLPNPEVYNYVFLGWYGADGQEVTGVPAGTTGDLTLNAYWTSKRNQTKAVEELKDPIICEDTDNGIIYFAYEIGTIQNVPLSDAIWTINAVAGLAQQLSQTVTTTVSNTSEKGIAYIVSKSTVDSHTWTLSEEWNESVNVNEEWAREQGYTEEEIQELAKTSSNTYSVTDTNGGASTTTNTDGTTTVKYDSKNEERSNGVEFDVTVGGKYSASATVSASGTASVPGASATASASATAGYEISGSISAGYDQKKTTNTHTGTDTTTVDTTVSTSNSNWSKSEYSSETESASESNAFSKAISEIICNTTGYGSSYLQGGSGTDAQGITNSASDSMNTTSTVTYFTSEMTTTTKTYSTDGKSEGSYRLVMAGTLHVYAVVGYDVATGSFFVYTYSVLDDKVEEFLDYSSDGTFTDSENGALPFEVPYFVYEYVAAKTVSTEGLEFKTNTAAKTATVWAYHGTDTDVIIPSYYVSNGTYYKVVGLEASSEELFAGKNIRSVILGEFIDEIPADTFKGCTELEQISGFFTKIGAGAFSGCTSLGKCINAETGAVTYNFNVSAVVTEIGEKAFDGVPQITVNALGAKNAETLAAKLGDGFTAGALTQKLLDEVTASGADSIILKLSSVVSDVPLTLTVPEMAYFELQGGKKTFTGLKLVSKADATVLEEITIISTNAIPLEISSGVLELEAVFVQSSSYCLLLSAQGPTVTLRRDNILNSSGSEAVVWNAPILVSTKVDGAIGYLDVYGNVYTCGNITGKSALTLKEGRIISISEDEFAEYIKGVFTVTFDANGGMVDETTRTIVYGQTLGTLPVPVRTGYAFEGWFTADGTQYTADSKLNVACDVTLYAKWSILSYTASWTVNVGCNIVVTRTSSPYASAAAGVLISGDTVYFGDVLSIQYSAQEGYTLYENGVTAITVEGNVTSGIYAIATVNAYTLSWNAGTGYTITVNRTSSPNANAATGMLSTGDTIYYGDVLTVSYAAATGYSLTSTGVTYVTVVGSVTADSIYADAAPNDYTYNVVYVSSNGTALGSTTVTNKYGTTNTISPAAYAGYTTPAAQNVVWDSVMAKTIIFTYVPDSVAFVTKTGTVSSSPKITYSAVIEYQNRTATSVQVRVKWTSTIAARSYTVYGQRFTVTAGATATAATQVAAFNDWKSSTSSDRSATGTSDWITIPLDTTNMTNVSLSVYYYQVNSLGTDMYKYDGTPCVKATWTVSIPAY